LDSAIQGRASAFQLPPTSRSSKRSSRLRRLSRTPRSRTRRPETR
jgi:hypothetical protein